MVGLSVLLFLISLIGAGVSLILLIIGVIRRRPKKKALLSIALCFVLFVTSVVIMPAQTETAGTVAESSAASALPARAAPQPETASEQSVSSSKPAASSQAAVSSQPAASSQAAASSQPAASSQAAASSQPAASSQAAASSQPEANSQAAASSQPAASAQAAASSQPAASAQVPLQPAAPAAQAPSQAAQAPAPAPAQKIEVSSAAPQEPVTRAAPQSGTVYWVEKGEVYHSSPNCPTLSKSKNIMSGTISQAQAAGKSRHCAKC